MNQFTSFSVACTADAQQERQALLQAPALLPDSDASGRDPTRIEVMGLGSHLYEEEGKSKN